MLKIDTILCPVDFSGFSDRAYDYAHSLARHYQAKLFVQHVTEPALSLYSAYLSPTVIDEVYSRQTANAVSRIRQLAEKHKGTEVQPEVVVQLGIVADSILSFAGEHDVDLIVMGTHGRRGLDRVMIGSTTERVLRTARCPVLAVHQPVRDFVSPASPDEPVQLRKILWCTDFSENSPRALEYALSLAFQYHAEITLLHVLEDGAGNGGRTQHALELLEQVIPDEARNRATVAPLVRTGKAYQEIIEQATQAQTDLIVMGVRGRGMMDLAIFGSTTHRVIQLGPCPVLAVRT